MEFFRSLREQYHLLRQRRKFFSCHGYRLNLDNPRSYNEKIIWRKIYDRNPLFPLLLDKYRSRGYVLEKLGKKDGEKILVPLLFATENPEEIPFDDLPGEYIVKPNHGSGWSIIVDASRPPDRERIVSECTRWLGSRYGERGMEWGYSGIRPLIMIEKLLRDCKGRLAADFKFYVFHGTVKMIYALHDRFGTPLEAFYDRDFRRLWVNTQFSDGPEIPKPESFECMALIAEKLSEDLDFLRVDLFNVVGNIFFGEFTLYPASGFYRYEPVDFEMSLGKSWDLNRKHMRKFRSWF